MIFVAVNTFKILGRIHSQNPTIIYSRFNSWQVPRLLWVEFILARYSPSGKKKRNRLRQLAVPRKMVSAT